MPYNESLAERIHTLLANTPGITSKKMFGGICFLLNGSMLCGVLNDKIVIRVHPDDMPELLARPYVKPMDFTGKPIKGFAYILPDGYRSTQSLQTWIDRSIDYVSSRAHKKMRLR